MNEYTSNVQQRKEWEKKVATQNVEIIKHYLECEVFDADNFNHEALRVLDYDCGIDKLGVCKHTGTVFGIALRCVNEDYRNITLRWNTDRAKNQVNKLFAPTREGVTPIEPSFYVQLCGIDQDTLDVTGSVCVANAKELKYHILDLSAEEIYSYTVHTNGSRFLRFTSNDLPNIVYTYSPTIDT